MAVSIKHKRILVVEDDPDVMKLLTHLLKEAGCEVHQANYGLPALFAVARINPDLILADITMPIMNGMDLLRQIKGHRETEHIPVVFLTGSDTPEAREAAFKAGCGGYITKPFDAHTLPKQLEHCLNPRAPLQG